MDNTFRAEFLFLLTHNCNVTVKLGKRLVLETHVFGTFSEGMFTCN